MATSVTKKNPNWLAKQSEFDPNLNKHYRRSVKYYRQLFQAWPEWCVADPRFKQIYREAARRRKRGENVQVDHIVPIISKVVCGLHVPWNLQIITELENNRKSNKWWPDNPFETLDLWPELKVSEPIQMRLI